jgi:hypothetical protein
MTAGKTSHPSLILLISISGLVGLVESIEYEK